MYVCGPTVYGSGHIGHARTYIAFDIIRKYFEFLNYDVKFVVNITDVHDDMIKQANIAGITIFELGEKYALEFFEDLKKLGIKKATVYPKVTQEINEIINLVKKLQEKGFAYETDDGVYYRVKTFKNYGKLSKLKFKKSITGTRVDTDKYEKEAAHDFALWKKTKPNEPFWTSPWGNGRPGWHIECSAMNMHHLGEQIDIHGGAEDLVFPHHENEIAQTEAVTNKQFVKYWLHSGFLNVEGNKMSKSLGNFITIPQLLELVNARVFRFFIAGLHYRSRINFSQKQMQKSKITLDKWDNFIERLIEIKKGTENSNVSKLIETCLKGFEKEMNDDFNTPNAWAQLYEFQKKINKLLDSQQIGEKNAENILNFLKKINTVFNVFIFEKKQTNISEQNLALIKQRDQMRKDKKWAESDKIREELLKKGIILNDTPQGTKWKLLK